MRLPRPHVPLAVRLEVARRQADARGFRVESDTSPINEQLRLLLRFLFGGMPAHLDHDPPLAVRNKIHTTAGEIVGYDPAANDPAHLIYRSASEHRLKTNTRGDGAQHPDRVLIKKIRRIERPKRKKKYNWPKRPFGKVKKHGNNRVQAVRNR